MAIAYFRAQMEHEKYMRRCLQLASLGLAQVSPNPMVGALVVYNDTIIGEGYHQKHGQAHAEVNAIEQVINKDLLKNSTLYVSLEPCAHFGKTPPCTDLIIAHKIPKVVIACTDSFSEVAGKGIVKLRAHGVEVLVGILEEDARWLNRRFFTFHEKKRPYIILKWAQSADGFIDSTRTELQKGSFKLTQATTQILSHSLRAQEDAILVGNNTIRNDNPSLTTRLVSGENPLRLSFLSKAEAPEANVFTDSNVFSLKKQTVENVVLELHTKGIQSVIIEGGTNTLQQFITADLWDEACVFVSQSLLLEGTKAPAWSIKNLVTLQYQVPCNWIKPRSKFSKIELISGDTFYTQYAN